MRECFRALRPKQWAKNVLVFAGLFFDQQFFDQVALLRVSLCFLLCCALSSAVYLINDLVDLESDRKHPTKRNRPLAAGSLSPRIAQVAAVILLAVSLLGSYALAIRLFVVFIIYLALQILYNLWLKKVIIIDIMVVSAGFILRVAAGTVVIQVARFSPWLYICTAWLALFLVVGKRRQDAILLADSAAGSPTDIRKYPRGLLDEMLRVITTATLIAYLIYTIDVEQATIGGVNLALITTVFVFYSLMRYLQLILENQQASAPEEVLFSDRPLQIAIVLWALSYLFILYVLAPIASP